jgi:hypothetical protein
MNNKIWFIFKVSTIRARKMLNSAYENGFYQRFYGISKAQLSNIIPEVPDIGNSIFAMNYYFCCCYIAWYRAFLELGIDKEAANALIWKINEAFIKQFPTILVKLFARHSYLGGFRKKAPLVQRQAEQGTLHPFDWKVRYKNIDKNTFELEIYECAMFKLCKKLDCRDLLPSICRMDYLFSHYMGNAFERTKTLGDGDDCCNCRYTFPGQCEWAPEKGFEDRK